MHCCNIISVTLYPCSVLFHRLRFHQFYHHLISSLKKILYTKYRCSRKMRAKISKIEHCAHLIIMRIHYFHVHNSSAVDGEHQHDSSWVRSAWNFSILLTPVLWRNTKPSLLLFNLSPSLCSKIQGEGKCQNLCVAAHSGQRHVFFIRKYINF